MISFGTENGRHCTQWEHSSVNEYSSINPRTTQKSVCYAKRNIRLKIVRISSLHHKIIVIVVFSDKTRNFTAEISMVDTEVICLR